MVTTSLCDYVLIRYIIIIYYKISKTKNVHGLKKINTSLMGFIHHKISHGVIFHLNLIINMQKINDNKIFLIRKKVFKIKLIINNETFHKKI